MVKKIIRDIVVGVVATQALDWVSIFVYGRESWWARLRENQRRGFKHAYERAVWNIAKAGGWSLSRSDMKTWGWRFHKAFGMLGGVGFAALRRRFPRVGAGLGMAFGATFFLLGDELLVPLSGLTPGPRAFSWRVHARGAAAHLAYGVAAETTARLLDADADADADADKV